MNLSREGEDLPKVCEEEQDIQKSRTILLDINDDFFEEDSLDLQSNALPLPVLESEDNQNVERRSIQSLAEVRSGRNFYRNPGDYLLRLGTLPLPSRKGLDNQLEDCREV